MNICVKDAFTPDLLLSHKSYSSLLHAIYKVVSLCLSMWENAKYRFENVIVSLLVLICRKKHKEAKSDVRLKMKMI